MLLRSLSCWFTGMATDRALQGGSEERQGPEAPNPTEARLDVEERGREPALLLVRGAPVRDLVRPVADQGVDGFEAVGGLQADPQGPEDPEPVQGEGFLESLLQTLHGRFVYEPQFLAEPEERCLGLGVARVRVSVHRERPDRSIVNTKITPS